MLMIELHKIKNELAPPIIDLTLNRKNIITISEIWNSFSQKERELFLTHFMPLFSFDPPLKNIRKPEVF